MVNNKTRLAGRATTNLHFKNTSKPSKSQFVPLPGTALCAFLKRYRNDLLDAERTGEVSLLLDCVDGLLLTAERGTR